MADNANSNQASNNRGRLGHNAGVSQEIRVEFTSHSSNAMNDRYTKLDRKPLGAAIEKLPMIDEE
ncbi:MAG: hypothetical protein WCS99_05025 [Limisphaerales bacterium]